MCHSSDYKHPNRRIARAVAAATPVVAGAALAAAFWVVVVAVLALGALGWGTFTLIDRVATRKHLAAYRAHEAEHEAARMAARALAGHRQQRGALPAGSPRRALDPARPQLDTHRRSSTCCSTSGSVSASAR